VSATVTPLRPAAGAGWRAEWPAVVADAVRPEFRVGVLYPERSNLVLFGRPCAVAGCPSPGRGRHLLCVAHGTQFRKRGGGLSVAAWLSRAGERGGPQVPRSMRELGVCQVAGCGRSAWTRVLCHSHHQRWRRTAGRPELAHYCVATPPDFEGWQIRPPSSCGVEGCRFPRMARTALCDGHQRRFADRRRRKGYTLERFLAECAHLGQPRYLFEALPEPLRSELQFGLQCFSDRRTNGMRPAVFADAVGRLRERGYRSLFDAFPYVLGDVSEETGRLLEFVGERLDELADAHRGREEWERDEWRIERLGIDTHDIRGRARISFLFCDELWLRALIKRWVRWRFGCGLALSTIRWNLRGVRLFVEFCQDTDRPLRGPSDITRELLEDWLAQVAALPVEPGTRARWLGALRLFLDDLRRHDWAPGLSPSATYHPREFGRRPESLPRFIDDRVIARLERKEALEMLPDQTTRTLVQILIETGLRAIDARTLPLDALSLDTAGAPYLRYFNHKLARERYLPITPALAEAIRGQQLSVRRRFPHGEPCLLPRERQNPDGGRPYAYGTLIVRLRAWVRALDLRDDQGRPVAVTPHRFRHTVATRMINSGVPQIAVQQLLDHESPRMTNVYARLHDQTLRAEFDRYQQRINIRGETVPLDPDGPLSDAAWAKENLARAKQTLPNGYCGLPLQQSCPHPNACLTCDHFLTTEEFLPLHRDQLERTEQLLADAERNGNQRLVEMNTPVKLNLVRIIHGLEALQHNGEEDADAA
jgi:integrase